MKKEETNNTNNYGKNMLLISSYWANADTFKMIPLTGECPYTEVIFDRSTGLLVVISKISKENFQLMPRLDDNGNPMKSNKQRDNGKPYKERRETIKVFQEYYIVEKKEQIAFVESFATNAKTFKFKPFMEEMQKETPVMGDTAPGLLTPEKPTLVSKAGVPLKV